MDKLKFWLALANNSRYKAQCLKVILNNMTEEEWSEFWLRNHQDIHWYNSTIFESRTHGCRRTIYPDKDKVTAAAGKVNYLNATPH